MLVVVHEMVERPVAGLPGTLTSQPPTNVTLKHTLQGAGLPGPMGMPSAQTWRVVIPLCTGQLNGPPASWPMDGKQSGFWGSVIISHWPHSATLLITTPGVQ
jgi:hypothetical protein